MSENSNTDSSYFCRVCGLYNYGEKPWGEDGESPTFDICPCCGVEFGYEDCSELTVKRYRKDWLERGGKWFSKSDKLPNWSLEDQMKNIPEEFK